MKFETQKTGKHLRAEALQNGSVERMRALQALSYGYGTGSNAALAKLLLATLGGEDSSIELVAPQGITFSEDGVTGTMRQVAQPMQQCANDIHHLIDEVTTAS